MIDINGSKIKVGDYILFHYGYEPGLKYIGKIVRPNEKHHKLVVEIKDGIFKIHTFTKDFLRTIRIKKLDNKEITFYKLAGIL